MNANSRLILTLPADLRARLEARSDQTGAPLVELIRRAITRDLDRLEREADAGRRRSSLYA